MNPKKAPWRVIVRLCALLLAALLSSTAYFALISLSEKMRYYLPVLEIFTIAAAVCLLVCAWINRGLGNDLYENPQNYCSASWSEEKKARFLASLSRRKKAKKLLSAAVFVLFVPVALDMFNLFLGDLFA